MDDYSMYRAGAAIRFRACLVLVPGRSVLKMPRVEGSLSQP
jgi:hypothetical protein